MKRQQHPPKYPVINPAINNIAKLAVAMLGLLWLLTGTAFAQASAACSAAIASPLFPATAKAALAARNEICAQQQAGLTPEFVDRIATATFDAARQDTSKVFGPLVPYFADWFSLKKDINGSKVSYYSYSAIVEESRSQGQDTLFLLTGQQVMVETPVPLYQQCQVTADLDCVAAANELARILNAMTDPIRQQNIDLTYDYVFELDARWDRYITEARHQTIIDIAATSLIYQVKTDTNHSLNAPPTTQLFVLHPAVLIENVSAAADGDQIQEALALEVLGVNWWDKNNSPCGIPCGVSAIVTYADREQIDDKGWGLMLTLDNKYSVGYTRHGSESGVFITVDLLKLFQDKKSQFTKWQQQLGQTNHE